MNRSPTVSLLAIVLFACDGASVSGDAGPPPPPVDSGPAVDAGVPEDLDGYIEHFMAWGGLPGAAVAIVTPDAVPLVGTYGFADIESERAVDEHTLFIMASISKTIAAVRAMQLVEEGSLDLDEPVGTYLGYEVPHPAYPAVPISTRMLMTHVSGLEDDFVTLGMATYMTDPPMTLDEFTRAYALVGGALYSERNWLAEPGTSRSYCNAGYGVVGQVLERAGGALYSEQARTAIFERIDMDGAGFFLREVVPTRLATPYGWSGRRYTPLTQSGAAFYPATSLRVSITGLARYAQMLLRGGEIDGTRILSEASVADMLTIQYPSISSGQALAFYERGVNGNRYIGHSGSTFGGSTQMLLSRSGTHAILLISNSDAYVRERVLGLTEGSDAIEAILSRLDEEAAAL